MNSVTLKGALKTCSNTVSRPGDFFIQSRETFASFLLQLLFITLLPYVLPESIAMIVSISFSYYHFPTVVPITHSVLYRRRDSDRLGAVPGGQSEVTDPG